MLWMLLLLLIGAPPSTQSVWHGGRILPPTLPGVIAVLSVSRGLAAVQAHGRGSSSSLPGPACRSGALSMVLLCTVWCEQP